MTIPDNPTECKPTESYNLNISETVPLKDDDGNTIKPIDTNEWVDKLEEHIDTQYRSLSLGRYMYYPPITTIPPHATNHHWLRPLAERLNEAYTKLQEILRNSLWNEDIEKLISIPISKRSIRNKTKRQLKKRFGKYWRGAKKLQYLSNLNLEDITVYKEEIEQYINDIVEEVTDKIGR